MSVWSVLEENVACESICHLVSEDLFVNCPSERLSDLVPEVGHAGHTGILGVVGVDDADEVIFGERLEVEEQVLHRLVVGLFVCGESGKQARQAVNHDHAKVHLDLPALELGQYHGEEHEKLLQVEDFDDSEA